MPRSPVRNSVHLYLQDPAPNDNFRIDGPPSTRLIELNADNNWTVRVGRATSTGVGPDEQKNNAAYRSRVVSREHAYITADPDNEVLTVTDADSMHGTHLHGTRLRPRIPYALAQDDRIAFGAAVDRGDETFLPIHVEVSWEWVLEEYAPPRQASPQYASNTFSVPDLSDDEIDDYDSEDGYGLKTEPTRFVPDSDHSDNEDSGMASDSIISDVDSPSSSPVASHHSVELATKSSSSAPIPVVPAEPQHIGQPQSSPATSRQKSGTQFGLSIAELLENEAERMANDDDSAIPGDAQDLGPSDEDEYPGEEFDEFSEVDEFDEEAAPDEATFTLQVPDAAPVGRDPSPSDAAMVKPTSETIRAPPFADLTPQQEAPAEINAGLHSRSNSAWAGHNSVLYDPPMPVPQMPDFYRNTMPPQNPQPYFASSWDPMLGLFEQYDQMHQPVAPARSFQSYDPGFGPSVSRKRKADEIDAEPVAAGPSIKVPAADLVAVREEADAHANDVPVLTASSVADIIKSPAPPVAESPRKKQKIDATGSGTRSSKGTTFTKYAMTALTGAAVGAVGAVLGLAALPQDFFT